MLNSRNILQLTSLRLQQRRLTLGQLTLLLGRENRTRNTDADMDKTGVLRAHDFKTRYESLGSWMMISPYLETKQSMTFLRDTRLAYLLSQCLVREWMHNGSKLENVCKTLTFKTWSKLSTQVVQIPFSKSKGCCLYLLHYYWCGFLLVLTDTSTLHESWLPSIGYLFNLELILRFYWSLLKLVQGT